MLSLVCQEPGTLKYREETYPVPNPGEVILKMTHLGICGTDLHAFEGNQPFFQYPRILGHEVAAIVEDPNGAVGFVKGEVVTVIPYFHCGKCIACRKGKTNCCSSLSVYGVHVDGAMKEYIVVPAYSLVKSSGLTGEELALVEPVAIGAHGITRAAICASDTVLVIGAGPIGLGTILMARLSGATVISFTRPMKEDIQKWYVVNNKEEMGWRAIRLLKEPVPDYTATTPFRLEDTVKKMMQLFSF